MWHFVCLAHSNRQAIFLELLERWLEGLDAQMMAVCAEADTIPEALLQMAGVAQQVSRVASEQMTIFLAFWTKAVRDPAIWQAIIAAYRRYQVFFSHLIKAGIKEGTLRALDTEMTG